MQLHKIRLFWRLLFCRRLNEELETDMKKMKWMCVTLMLLGSVPPGPAWADRGGHHGHHHGHGHHHRHHHHGGGWGFGGYGAAVGMGLLGYGLGSFFGARPSYYGGYGYAPAYGYAPPVVAPPIVAAPAVPPVYVQRQDVVHVPAQPQVS